MKISGINYNDFLNGKGVCLSVWFQGCVHHCPGCHNPETWSFDGGYEIDEQELYKKVLDNICTNGIQRNLSLLGGEPLCEQNITQAIRLLSIVKEKYPNIHTFVWTGYRLEELINMYGTSILKNIDTLIDGKFIQEQRDITLELRGSRNQRILNKGIDY